MAWIDGNPAVVGGKTMNNDTQSVEILKASKWIEDSPINVPRNSHISVTISQGVWTLGGLFNKMRLVSIENYKNHAWSVVVLVLPIPWSDILACSLGNNLLLLGGKTTSNIVTDMVIYISTDVFSITQLVVIFLAIMLLPFMTLPVFLAPMLLKVCLIFRRIVGKKH